MNGVCKLRYCGQTFISIPIHKAPIVFQPLMQAFRASVRFHETNLSLTQRTAAAEMALMMDVIMIINPPSGKFADHSLLLLIADFVKITV